MKKKFELTSLKVQSFTTKLDAEKALTAKGGQSGICQGSKVILCETFDFNSMCRYSAHKC